MGFPSSSDSKASACNAGDLDSTPGSGRSPGEGNGNSLQYSCLENPHAQKSLVGYNPWGRRVRHNWVTNTYTHHHHHGRDTLVCNTKVESIIGHLWWAIRLGTQKELGWLQAFYSFVWGLISRICSLKKAFLSLLAILWSSAFSWVYLTLSPLPFASILFSASL